MTRFLTISVGLAIWWLLVPLERYLAADGWRLMSSGRPILVVFVCILTACFKLRKNEFGVLLWSPLFVLCSWILITFIPAFFGELSAVGMSGGGAPLGGIAMLLGLSVLVATFVAFILCIVSFPRNMHWGLLGISLANSAAIAFTIWSTTEAEARQMITVQILDSSNQPVTGARVTYKVYAYGPGGSRPPTPAIIGGPILTNDQGIAMIRSKKIRYEVLMNVAKDGYQPISAEIEMQFYNYDVTRHLKIDLGKLSNIAYCDIPCADPVKVTLYLPPLKDRPEPLRYKESKTFLSNVKPSRQFLDVQTGWFVDNPDSDLRFDILPTYTRDGMHITPLKITALRGAGIRPAPSLLTSGNDIPLYEQMMHIAPSSGYSDQITLGGPWYYFRKADGSLYGRLQIELYPSVDGGSVYVHFWVNPSGSRNLLFDPDLEIKTPSY